LSPLSPRLLVDLGLAPSRERAQRLILAGDVLVGDRPATKPGALVAADAVSLRKGGGLVDAPGRGLVETKAIQPFEGTSSCVRGACREGDRRRIQGPVLRRRRPATKMQTTSAASPGILSLARVEAFSMVGEVLDVDRVARFDRELADPHPRRAIDDGHVGT
jgi:S4 domain